MESSIKTSGRSKRTLNKTLSKNYATKSKYFKWVSHWSALESRLTLSLWFYTKKWVSNKPNENTKKFKNTNSRGSIK